MEIIAIQFTQQETRAVLAHLRGHTTFSPLERAALKRGKDKLAAGLLEAGEPVVRRGSYASHADEFPEAANG